MTTKNLPTTAQDRLCAAIEAALKEASDEGITTPELMDVLVALLAVRTAGGGIEPEQVVKGYRARVDLVYKYLTMAQTAAET